MENFFFGFWGPEIDMIRRQLKSKIISKTINERMILTGREEEGFLPFVSYGYFEVSTFYKLYDARIQNKMLKFV